MSISLKALLIGSIAIWSFLIFMALFYRFDGSWFPVTSLVRFDETDIRFYLDKPGGWSLISGEFDKYRNCVFRGIEWNYTSEKNQGVVMVSIPADFEDRPVIRPVRDRHQFERLAVQLANPDDIINHSIVYVYHDCYNGWLWNTKTLFYQHQTF